MDLLEKLIYPIYQAAIFAIAGFYFLCRQRYRPGLALLAFGAAWLWLCATPAMAVPLARIAGAPLSHTGSVYLFQGRRDCDSGRREC